MTSLSWNEFFSIFNDSKPSTVIAYGPVFPESPTKPDVVQASVDYFIALTQNLGQDVTVVTCDQAIYDIVKGFTTKYKEKYKNLIVRLGGFHTVSNFSGAIGNIMQGSGIDDIMVQSGMCMPGTANKVLSGKDYYKMVRYHSLLNANVIQFSVHYYDSF